MRPEAAMPRSCFLALILLSGITASVSAEAPGALPFGLTRLHWGMPQNEAVTGFSALASPLEKPDDAPLVDRVSLFFGPYSWRACSFQIWTYFADAKLDRIVLESRGQDASCRADAYAELKAALGNPAANEKLDPEGRGHLNFRYMAGNTFVVLNDDRAGQRFEIALVQHDGPPMTISN